MVINIAAAIVTETILQTDTERQAAVYTALQTGKNLGLVYVDEDGVTSLRYIQVVSVRRSLDDNLVIGAQDLQRQAPRYFRMDRIAVAQLQA